MAENENQNPVPVPNSDNPPTTADIAGGKIAGIVKKLETRISVLEDTNKGLKEQNAALETRVGALAKLPSQVVKGKTLLDDLEELVFGPKSVSPVNPPIPPTN